MAILSDKGPPTGRDWTLILIAAAWACGLIVMLPEPWNAIPAAVGAVVVVGAVLAFASWHVHGPASSQPIKFKGPAAMVPAVPLEGELMPVARPVRGDWSRPALPGYVDAEEVDAKPEQLPSSRRDLVPAARRPV